MWATTFYFKEANVWAALKLLDNRYWLCMGVGDPFQSWSVPIVVEVNPPHRGIDHRKQGVIATDAAGKLHLFHRGKAGGGRAGIGKFLDSYDRVFQVSCCKACRKPKDMAWIASLATDPTQFVSDMAHFIQSVASYKARATG
jgi:hypothetical protein